MVEAARLQNAQGLECVVLDGLEPLPFPDASFERVLVDAPCSGTGTLRRNPEIRWRISAEDIRDLSTRQARLLDNASLVVKPGGRLVYSTCSVEPEENEAIIRAFLREHSRFQQVGVDLLFFPSSQNRARYAPGPPGMASMASSLRCLKVNCRH